ncbi:MAG: hypothetical protein FRX48_05488 [Lasallia pustulata]|uniref:Uncharacterized protein n=1 Tax=Lasallia pustulata TaxID=136370 RepID=A0A5M8PRH7_9LECA|nr:MAG: hypothetical protein FRX48_05488 [Lasallia pustulata]
METSLSTSCQQIYRRWRRTPDGWPTARATPKPPVKRIEIVTEADSHDAEDLSMQKPGLKYLKDLFLPPPCQPSKFDFDYHPSESREGINVHAGDPHQWLPSTHRYMCQPSLPNLALPCGPTSKTDWSAYLAWVENNLSYRERTEDNVLLINDMVKVLSASAAASYINFPHLAGPAEWAVLLFYDLPVTKAGAVVGSEVYVLGYDLLEEKFIVVRFEECPVGLRELAVGWREKGSEMCRRSFQEIDRVLDDPKLADKVSPNWEREFGSRVLPEWKEELGLKICALLFITQFVLDYQGTFNLDLHEVWHLQALLTAWRRKIGRGWFATKKTTALDLSDPGMSSGSSASPVDGSFDGPEGSPGSVTFSFGNPNSKKEKKELLASLESYKITLSRGNTYKRRPEQCIYDEEDEEGWGALEAWAASQQGSAVKLAGSNSGKIPFGSNFESIRYATSSDEGISPTTTFANPPEDVPSLVPLLELNHHGSSDATADDGRTNLNTPCQTHLEGSSVVAIASALKELVEKRPGLDSAKNKKKLRELLAELVNEAEAIPLEVQREVIEPTDGRRMDGKAMHEAITGVLHVGFAEETKEANGLSGEEIDLDEGYGEGKSVRFVEGPHPIVIIPEEEVSIVG